jgi:hypothetical protein
VPKIGVASRHGVAPALLDPWSPGGEALVAGDEEEDVELVAGDTGHGVGASKSRRQQVAHRFSPSTSPNATPISLPSRRRDR